MASTSVAVQRAAARSKYGPIDWWGGWRTCILACLGFTVLFVVLGLYMHAFAWYAGIDASSPEFALYWRSLLILELVGVGIGTIAWWAWLVRSGRTLAQAITHEEEVRRIVVFWGLIGATSVVLYFTASVTEMMQVAMNEWGHSLWITEEFFAAPFHWPFVTYGWLASGIFALWAESALRLLGIEKEAEDEAQPAVASSAAD